MKSPLVSTVLVIAVILAIIGGFAIVIEQNKAQTIDIRADLLAAEERLISLENILSILLEDNEELAGKLKDAEEERQLFEDEQATLFADVGEQFSTLADEDATVIVERWEPFVYQIQCTFENDEGGSSGSTIVERHDETLQFVTNQHILEEDDLLMESCLLTKPKSGKDLRTTVLPELITYEKDDEIDIGFGIITENIPAVDSSRRCSSVPAIGDRVVILGYPGIGAEDSITATEGIISGFQDDYYITSAKIDKGNSGSAAIHVKNDCLLGLPTIVVPGKLESLARILPLMP